MKSSLVLFALLLCGPASAELLSYSVSGSIDTITPGPASGSGLPSGFDVDDEFLLEISIDTNQPMVDLSSYPWMSAYLMEASIALHVGSASVIEPSRSVFVTINCAYVYPCLFSIGRAIAYGPIVPFDDTFLGNLAFTAAFADEETGMELGAPLVPSGREGEFFLSTCMSPSNCLIVYTAIGTVSSIHLVEGVPGLGPIGLVCLVGSIVAASRLAARARGRRSGD